MLRTSILSGNLDLTGALVIGLIVLGSLGGLSLVIVFIFAKVFRGRKENLTAINLGRPERAKAGGVETTEES